MKEPQTIEECLEILARQASSNPSATLLAILDQLVDLACSGGSLMPNRPVQSFVKLRFYKTVIARLVVAGVRPAAPVNHDDQESGGKSR